MNENNNANEDERIEDKGDIGIADNKTIDIDESSEISSTVVNDMLATNISKISSRQIASNKDGITTIRSREYISVDDIRISVLLSEKRKKKKRTRKKEDVKRSKVDRKSSNEEAKFTTSVMIDNSREDVATIAEDDDSTGYGGESISLDSEAFLLDDLESSQIAPDFNRLKSLSKNSECLFKRNRELDLKTIKNVIPTIPYAREDEKPLYDKDAPKKLNRKINAFYTYESLKEYKDKLIYLDNGLEIPEEKIHPGNIKNMFGGSRYAPGIFTWWFRNKIITLLMKNDEYLTRSDAIVIYRALKEFIGYKDWKFFYENFYVNERND